MMQHREDVAPSDPTSTPHLAVIARRERPVLAVGMPGTEGIRYGFEGGRALAHGGAYHLFTSEMAGDPMWVKMRLAHWASDDRIHWRRVSTLFESSGDDTGDDGRAALWSPMPVYDDARGRWTLFYVAYRVGPVHPNVHGRIWRAVSTVAGPDGLGGPYADAGVVLEPGPDSDPWEGLQGTDSFFPYQVGDRWYAFYGSANIETTPPAAWRVGLAAARDLAGPWARLSRLNPLAIEPRFIENPVVTRLGGGLLVAVYDTGINKDDAIGWAYSRDGVAWARGEPLVVQPGGPGRWARLVRTPLGLIPAGDGSYTLLYTAYRRDGDDPSGDGQIGGDAAVGLATVSVEGA